MNQVYTLERNRIDRSEVIRISDEYWNEHVSEFLKNKESFDKQMIEFLKNVHDIHSKEWIQVRTPAVSKIDRRILHTFAKTNILYLQTEKAFNQSISFTHYPMLITFVKKPDVPKDKRSMDENTKLYLENIKNTMFQQFQTMWDTTMNEHFAN